MAEKGLSDKMVFEPLNGKSEPCRHLGRECQVAKAEGTSLQGVCLVRLAGTA